jgi:hypothetical protein
MLSHNSYQVGLRFDLLQPAAAVVATVEPHVWRDWPIGTRLDGADVTEADDLGPEPVLYYAVIGRRVRRPLRRSVR